MYWNELFAVRDICMHLTNKYLSKKQIDEIVSGFAL